VMHAVTDHPSRAFLRAAAQRGRDMLVVRGLRSRVACATALNRVPYIMKRTRRGDSRGEVLHNTPCRRCAPLGGGQGRHGRRVGGQAGILLQQGRVQPIPTGWYRDGLFRREVRYDAVPVSCEFPCHPPARSGRRDVRFRSVRGAEEACRRHR
jgi:hypothetical protein